MNKPNIINSNKIENNDNFIIVNNDKEELHANSNDVEQTANDEIDIISTSSLTGSDDMDIHINILENGAYKIDDKIMEKLKCDNSEKRDISDISDSVLNSTLLQLYETEYSGKLDEFKGKLIDSLNKSNSLEIRIIELEKKLEGFTNKINNKNIMNIIMLKIKKACSCNNKQYFANFKLKCYTVWQKIKNYCKNSNNNKTV